MSKGRKHEQREKRGHWVSTAGCGVPPALAASLLLTQSACPQLGPSPPCHPCAEDSGSFLTPLSWQKSLKERDAIWSHSVVLVGVFEGKRYHLTTFTKTNLLLFLHREISVKGAKGQSQRLGSKEVLSPGLCGLLWEWLAGNGCSERKLVGGV